MKKSVDEAINYIRVVVCCFLEIHENSSIINYKQNFEPWFCDSVDCHNLYESIEKEVERQDHQIQVTTNCIIYDKNCRKLQLILVMKKDEQKEVRLFNLGTIRNRKLVELEFNAVKT